MMLSAVIRVLMVCGAVSAFAIFGVGSVGCSGDSDHGHGHEHGHVHGDGDGHGHAHPHGDGDGHGEGSGHDADGHGHDGGDGHGHDEDGHGHAHGESEGHGAGAIVHTVDAQAFGGRGMTVEVAGSLVPGSELHVEGTIDVGAGVKAPVLRMWVGDASGVGSMKARGSVHGGHFHVHVMVPDPVPAGSALWIEAMGGDGERQSVSIAVE